MGYCVSAPRETMKVEGMEIEGRKVNMAISRLLRDSGANRGGGSVTLTQRSAPFSFAALLPERELVG